MKLEDLQIIPNAAQPTAGQGLVLDLNGQLPQAVRQTLPGYLLDYVEVTSNQTSTATTAAGATAIVTGNAIFYDGATVIRAEFQAPQIWHSVADTAIILELYDGATDLGVIGVSLTHLTTNSASVPVARTFTPTVGTHTYSIRMWSTAAGTATAQGGAGGAGTAFPMYLRITHA